MTTWTTIPDASLDPTKPARAIDAKALRDNPIAIAEGASGAPKINSIAAMDHGGSVGAVGTYALLQDLTTPRVSLTEGSTRAGSSLRYAGASVVSGSVNVRNAAPAGTWRLMGVTGYTYDGTTFGTDVNYTRQTSLWLRIS